MPPKKKSVKKEPKAPVGRPRKKLGTRVSDLPVVSTIRPRASRSNQDSMALQRARLQYKRDYPKETGIDEYKSRALLDVMADASRGAIGNRVLGPAQYELDEIARKLAKAKLKNKPLVLTDGKVFINKKAAKQSVASVMSALLANAAGPSATPALVNVAAPALITQAATTGKDDRTRSQTRRLANESLRQQRAQVVRQQEEMEAKAKKRKRTAEPRQADEDQETAQERELRSIKSALSGDLAPDDRMQLIQRMRALNQQLRDREQVDVTPRDEPATQRSLTTAQETQVLRIVNQFAAPELTQAGADIIATARDASPRVQQAVVTALGNMSSRFTDPEKLAAVSDVQRLIRARLAKNELQKRKEAKAKEPAVTPEVAALQATFDDMKRASDEDKAARIAAEAARQYGRPSSEEQLANQRRGEELAARLKAEDEESPLEFRPRRAARDDTPKKRTAADYTPEERAAADVINNAIKARKVRNELKEGREATTTLQAAIRRRNVMSDTEKARVREIERLEQEAADQEAEVRQEMMDQAVQEQLQADEAAGVDSFVGPAIRDAAADAADGDIAASKIQRMIRARRGREADRLSEYQRLAAERDLRQKNETQRDNAASTIQAAIRSALARGELKSRADRAYRPAEGPVYDEEAANDRDAALRIQSLFRGKRTRKELAEAAKSAALEGITQTLKRGNEEAAKQDTMNKMLDDMFEGSIPTVDRTDDIRRESASKIQSAFRNRVRRRDPGEQADLDAQYAALFAAQDDGRRPPGEQAALDDEYAALFNRGNIDEMREKVIQTHRDEIARRVPMMSEDELAVARQFRDSVIVPGADIRPNTRTIPVPPPLPPRRPTPLLEDIVGPIESDYGQPRNTPTSGFRRQGISKKGHAEAAKLLRPFEGQQSRISDFSPGDLSQQVLREQRGRLKPPAPRIATEEDIDRLVDTTFNTALQRALQAKFANTRQEEDDGDFDIDPNLADRIRRRNEDTERLLQETTGSGLVGGGRPNRRFVGGVLRRLRGMGFFDGFDSLSYNIHGTPDDNKKDLADAKAAYAARGGAMGGTFDGRTDFRVLMDAMKNIPRRQGGAMGGGRVFLSGVSAPTGGGAPVLYEITFPVQDWKTSSSLRWLRSNGIKPMKKAAKSGSVYKYAIASSKGLKDPYTSDLISRGRKIHMVYGMAA